MVKVEPLRPQPSFEHQQKLAKRLLREVWAGEPAALERVRSFLPVNADPESLKLHQAQLVIARGYGFDTGGDEAQDRVAYLVAA